MRLLRSLLVAALAAALLLPATAAAAAPRDDRAVLVEYARDTWRSFTAMVDERTGLPADNIAGDLDTATRSGYTSPTNIGGYLWSTVVARDLGIVAHAEARDRMAAVLSTLERLERHEQSGMFYNWYSEASGEKLTVWPTDGNVVHPFLSSVDNGWLAAALLIVSRADPQLAAQATRLFDGMDFGFYYDPDARPDVGAGLIRGGFWDVPPPGCSTPGNYRGGADVSYTCHHYGALNTEPRIASYLGIAAGDIPTEHYYAMWRTFPDTCDWGWVEQQPTGETRTYLGVPVFEGTHSYRGARLVPTWGGSMFEALMPDLFVPEAQWGPRSWGINHPLTVQAHIEHGMDEAGYGAWGFSPSSDPFGGYREYGVDAIGIEPNGYSSDRERTTVDPGFGECRPAQPEPAAYGDGVVTPHASFLALPYAREAALDNLAHLRDDLGAYGPGGFHDAVAVRSGTVAQRYLSLDQAMVMAALGNELRGDLLRRLFSRGDIEQAIRPLLAAEEFSSAPRR